MGFGERLYLIMVCAAFLTFSATLMWVGRQTDRTGTASPNPGIRGKMLRRLVKFFFLPVIMWSAIFLLFYNYVILQWGLVWPRWHDLLPVALFILAILSGLFCCVEMAISNTTPEMLDTWVRPYQELPSDEFVPYEKKWKRHLKIVKNNETYNPVVVLINNLLNVGLAVVCIVAINGSINKFAAVIPSLPFFGEILCLLFGPSICQQLFTSWCGGLCNDWGYLDHSIRKRGNSEKDRHALQARHSLCAQLGSNVS